MKLITTALIAAKAQFNPIHKNKLNPYFQSKYATLDEILEAIAPALLANNLLLIQPTLVKDNLTILKTILIHVESGEQLESELTIPTIADPQKLGAAMTYYRRFSICSLLAIAPDDDDDGTTATATAIVKTTSPVPKADTLPDNDRVLSQTASRSTVNREIELRNLMRELNLPSHTVTELVRHHFGIDCRINLMTPAKFTQLLTLMRQTANLEGNGDRQTNGVERQKVRA
jgi:ERF superfamily